MHYHTICRDCVVRYAKTKKTAFKNGLTLQPLNNRYEPQYYSAQQVQSLPVRILGVVVEIRRKVRRK